MNTNTNTNNIEAYEARIGEVLKIVKNARKQHADGQTAEAKETLVMAKTLLWFTEQIRGADTNSAIASKLIERLQREWNS